MQSYFHDHNILFLKFNFVTEISTVLLATFRENSTISAVFWRIILGFSNIILGKSATLKVGNLLFTLNGVHLELDSSIIRIGVDVELI